MMPRRIGPERPLDQLRVVVQGVGSGFSRSGIASTFVAADSIASAALGNVSAEFTEVPSEYVIVA